jgi:hypothetical protein
MIEIVRFIQSAGHRAICMPRQSRSGAPAATALNDDHPGWRLPAPGRRG